MQTELEYQTETAGIWMKVGNDLIKERAKDIRRIRHLTAYCEANDKSSFMAGAAAMGRVLLSYMDKELPTEG